MDLLRLLLVVFLMLIREMHQLSPKCSRQQFYTVYKDKPVCVDCFCSEVINRCRRALYFQTKLYLQDVTHVKAVSQKSTLPANAVYYSSRNEVILGDLEDLGETVVYWILPKEFLGNQAFAYGGFLQYTVFYDVLSKSRPYIAADVKITGANGKTISYTRSTKVEPRIALMSKVQILERNFNSDSGESVTRVDLMKILSDVKELLVRATYAKHTKVTLINDISISSATPFYSKTGRTIFLEHCLCPQGYHGLSCERCQRGFKRLILLSGEKKCVRCQCHRHSLDCDPDTGVCKNCQDNTEGDNCERCIPGYYGNAKQGTTEDCKRCACPLLVESNQFSPTCRQTPSGNVKCDACKDGYRGADCGECAAGYAGNPRTPGGRCHKASRAADRMPKIYVRPSRRTDPIGYRSTFTCKVSGLGRLYVTWSRKDARPLPKGRSRVLARGNSWILIISSLRSTDRGDYVCTARNRYGIASHTAVVSIYALQVPPIEVKVTPKSLRITEGSAALFLCSVNTVATTHTRSWSREGYRLLPSNAKVLDGTLSFRNAKKEDSGVYTCSASNQVSVDSATIVLSVGVISKPQISIWPMVQTVDVGRPVRFHCSAAGFPRPEIFWSRDGSNEEERSYTISGNGIINIDRARITDEGKYACTARNDGGEVTSKAVLYVRSPNRRLSISVFPKKVKAYAGEKVLFRCASSGESESILRWNIKSTSRVHAKDGLLTFESVTIEDDGLYVCTASNRYGTVSAKVKLVVAKRHQSALKVKLEPEFLVIEEGQSAELRCNVTGNFSVITWSKDDGMLSDNHLVTSYQLNITRATVKDSGTYFCMAKIENILARSSSIVLVNRNIVPNIVILPSSNLTASIGDTVHFRCLVTEGQPVADMVWYKNNVVLSTNESSKANYTAGLLLTFASVTKSEEGAYFCAAVNKAGFARELATLSVSGRPNIVLTPQGLYNATKGDELLFECKATGFPVPRVRWSLPSASLLQTSVLTSWPGYARIELKATGSVEGRFNCIASNAEGEVEDSITVKVKNESSKPAVMVHPKALNAVRGGSVELDCTPLGVPTPESAWVKLRRNARSILLSKRKRLTLEDIQLNDEGTYACRAWNRFGNAEAYTKLTVSIPPTITVFPTSLIVQSGRSFSLDCEAHGFPTPIVEWQVPGDLEDKDFILKDGKLEVDNSRGSHRGTYKCISANIGGNATKTVNVTVLVQPEILSSSKEDIIEKLGGSVALFCNASGFPEPEISWFKDQTSLPSTKKGELYIKNLTADSQGQYRCVANNLAGQTEKIFSLAIEELPTASILEDTGASLKIIPVLQPVTLTCITSGNPEPQVRWTKTNDRLPESVIVEGGILRIAKANVEDSGTFRCSAQNPIGFVHADIQIFIQGAPIVKVSPKRLKVQIGREARISCSASGSPIPRIKWKKVGGVLPRHYIEKHQLVIPKIKRDDEGDYVCMATNAKGTAEDHFKLRTTDFLPRFSEDGQSYIIYGKILGALYQTKIEITFRLENENGLLLYNGKQEGDFISLGVHQGFVVFQYNLGSGPAYIRSNRKVSLFKWHTAKAYRDGLDGTLTIDRDPIVYGKSNGKYTGLNLNGDLFIGGHANLHIINRQTSHKRGFTGCISQIVIAGRKFDIGEDALMKVGISDCNICLTQPCKNDGICLASASSYGFKCECEPGFSGPICDDRVERCFPGACGEGVCSDTGSSMFTCKCPLGSYGKRCEFGNAIRVPMFANHSYMTFAGVKGAWEELHIFIKFKPISGNGIIMYNPGSESIAQNQDYVLVQLINGYIQLKYDCGSGPAIIMYHEKVLLNSWNTVEIDRFRQYGSISLNGNAAMKGVSEGHSISLNLGASMFIGGNGTQRNVVRLNSSNTLNGFNGCIQDLVINGNRIDLVKGFLANKDIMDCDSKLSPCVPSPCLNNGTCQIFSAVTYKCICPLKYFGVHCESFRRGCGDVETCQNGGKCIRNRKDKLNCHCKLGFVGLACEKAFQIRKEALFKGNGYLQFPRHLLSESELSNLKFDLKTTADNGLIFWFGEEEDDSNRENPDFLAIGLKNGFLEISYELGSGLAVILTERPFNDGSWHTVYIARSSKNASLVIDGKLFGQTQSSGMNTHLDIEAPIFFVGLWVWHYTGNIRQSLSIVKSSVGLGVKSTGDCSPPQRTTRYRRRNELKQRLMWPFYRYADICRRNAKRWRFHVNSIVEGENLRNCLSLGGGKNVELLTRQKYKDSYFGCIGNVYVENREVLLQDMAEDGLNIFPCTEDSI